MMNFGFGVNDAYFPYISVVAKSILVHHPDEDLAFYILTDHVSERNRERFRKEMEGYGNVRWQVITVDPDIVSSLRTGSLHESTWFRVLLVRYLPVHVQTILYLDADTLVTDRLNGIFDTEMEGYSIAACLDPANFDADTFARLRYDRGLQYVCAGVLLVNLSYWRQHGVDSRILEYAQDHPGRLRYLDQCAINVVCKDSKRILPLRYGVMGCFFSPEWFGRIGSREELRECLARPAIIHFAGNAPWKKELAPLLFHDEWQRYNKMLKHPVRRRYSVRGFALLKRFAWNLLHRETVRRHLVTRESALRITNGKQSA